MGGVARSKVKDLRLPVDAAVIPGGESSEGKVEDRLWGRSGRAGCFYTQLSVEEKKKKARPRLEPGAPKPEPTIITTELGAQKCST